MDLKHLKHEKGSLQIEKGKKEEREQREQLEELEGSYGFFEDPEFTTVEEKLRFLEQERGEYFKIKVERDQLLAREKILQQQLSTTQAQQNRGHILEDISDAFFFFDNDWRFVYLNTPAQKLLARSSGELLGHILWEEYPHLSGTIFSDKYHQAVNSGQAVHFEGFYPPLNSWFDVHAYPSGEGLSIYLNNIDDRKRTHQELEEQKRLLNNILASTTEGILGVDLGGRCTFINQAALNLLGYNEEECLGQPIHELIHYKQADGAPYSFKNCPLYQTLIVEKPIKLLEEVLWHKNGSPLPALYSSSPVFENEVLTGAVVTISDLRERKQTEALLEETAARFRFIWEAASDAVALSDAGGTVLAANPAYFALYGYKSEEIIGHNYSVIFPEHLRQFARENYTQVFKGPKSVQAYEAVIKRVDGTERVVEAGYDFIVHNGVRTAMVSVVRDITERKRSEKERDELFNQLQTEQSRLRALIENVSTGILLAEAPSGQIVTVNHQAALMLGLPGSRREPRSEPVAGSGPGLGSGVLSHIDEEYSKARDYTGAGNWFRSGNNQRLNPTQWPLARALAGEFVKEEELIYQRENGTRVYFSVNAIPIRNNKGELVWVVITLYNVSERKRAEQMERFLNDFAARLLPLAQEEKVYRTAATFLGRFLKSNRCFFASFDLNSSQTFVHYNYTSGQEFNNLESTYNLTRNDPKILKKLKSGSPVILSETGSSESEIDPELQNTLFSSSTTTSTSAGFYSTHFKGQTLLVVPLIKMRKLELVVGVQVRTGTHRWQKDELVLLQHVLERVWLSAQNARLFQKAQQAAVQEERTRIARELHDSLQQEFYGIQLSSNITLALLKSYPGIDIKRVLQQLEETVQLAEGGLVELRSLIFDLMPGSLAKLGLVVGLQNNVHTLEARHRLKVKSDLGSEPPIKDDLKEVLYFIAREALFNIVKHAAASEVEIKLVWNEEKRYVELTVKDNGVGFEVKNVYPGHYGLEAIKERASKAGGTVNIQSKKEAGTSTSTSTGTTIQVIFPL